MKSYCVDVMVRLVVTSDQGELLAAGFAEGLVYSALKDERLYFETRAVGVSDYQAPKQGDEEMNA